MKKAGLIFVIITLCFVFLLTGIFVGRSMPTFSVYTDNTLSTQATDEVSPHHDGKININLATKDDLLLLPGIANSLAESIIEYRSVHGDFNKIEDIMNVEGIGQKRFTAIKDFITAGG